MFTSTYFSHKDKLKMISWLSIMLYMYIQNLLYEINPQLLNFEEATQEIESESPASVLNILLYFEGTVIWTFHFFKTNMTVSASELLTSDSSLVVVREKGRDLTQSYDKSPYTNRNVKIP